MRTTAFILALALSQLAMTVSGRAQFGFGAPSKASVVAVAEVDAIQPGVPFFAGIKIEIEPGWHSYWKNTGSDSGIATTISWDLPEGFSAGELLYPTPHYELTQGSASHVYSGTVYHVAQITPPADLAPGTKVQLAGTVDLLACDATSCETPKPRTISLSLPVVSDVPPPSREAAGIQAMLDDSPLRLPKWDATTSADGDRIILTVAVPAGVTMPLDALYFFPDEAGIVAFGKESQSFAQDGQELRISLQKAEGSSGGAPSGLLVSESEIPSLPVKSFVIGVASTGTVRTGQATDAEVAAVVEKKPGGLSIDELTPEDEAEIRAAIKEMVSWVEQESRPIQLMLVFAFLGGILLNLMPCVFPVLGIKIMGFVAQAGEDKVKIRKHGLVFASGVLLSLWVLVTALLILKYTGEKVGWGFQLQDPAFLAVMILILFAFGLNLSGLFEIGSSLSGAGAELQQKHGYSGSFFSGVLAVLVATPCTGPFMGPAIGFALTSSAVQTFAIFTALGGGLALPYVVLSFFPALIQKLPKPGPWMVAFKQFMAFPLYFTVVWLVGVFGKVTGLGPITYLLLGLATLAFALWIYGRYASAFTASKSRTFGRFGTVAIAALAGWFTYGAVTAEPDVKNFGDATTKHGIAWQGFDPREIVQARKKGRTIFIDFTADW